MHLFKPKFKTAEGYKEARNWAVKFQQDGRQLVKSTGTPNKAAAMARAKLIIGQSKEQGWEILKPKLPGARRTPVETVIDLYRDFAASTGLAPRTVGLNVSSLRRFALESGSATVEEMAGKWPEWRRVNRAVKQTTADAILRSCKSVFKPDALAFYSLAGHEVKNPFSGQKQERGRIEPFKGYPRDFIGKLIGEAKRDLKESDPSAWRLFILCLYAGTRQQEALWARWEDLRDNGILIADRDEHRTKGKRSRFVPMAPEIVEGLRATRDHVHEWIIPPERISLGMKRRWTKIPTRLGAWLRAHGLKVPKPVHELRKIAGAIMATDHGLYAAKELLGHSTVSVTEGFYAALLDKPHIRIGV